MARYSICNLHHDAGRRVPNALACRQIGVHVLLGPRLDDLHPLHPAKRNGHGIMAHVTRPIIITNCGYI